MLNFYGDLVHTVILTLLFTGVLYGVIRFMIWPLVRRENAPSPYGTLGTEQMKIILPLRLQACERFVLYLERIHPQNLLLRLSQAAPTAPDLQVQMIRTIREEFEYNLSQQLYISPTTWELIRNAKEEMISLVNRAATSVHANGTVAALIQAVLDLSMEKGELPVDKAIEAVKKEIRGLL
jgi:hypothetical protein